MKVLYSKKYFVISLIILIGLNFFIPINKIISLDKKENDIITQNKNDLSPENNNEISQELQYFYGYIDNIKDGVIYIDTKHYGYIELRNNSKIINVLTAEEMQLNEIKSGDYFFIEECYKNEDVISSKSDIQISRNISGEEMKEEILKGYVKRSYGITMSPDIKEIQYMNSNKEALITFEVGYPFADIFQDKASEYYSFQFIINLDTTISSKSRLINSINDLAMAQGNLVNIVLDKNTIHHEHPVITSFFSFDGN